jgi:hypothetical protein
MFRLVCESMLANVIAFEEAGVPLQELKQSVGRDGGMIIGRGVVLQTPIERHLSDEDAKSLIERYSELLGDYNAGRLDRHLINNLKLRNNVSAKVGIIRSSLREQRRR